jgi:PQQ-dependent catabolism-associated CXXCW motif protein
VTSDDAARAPYPGLRSFRRDESDLFFGREDCVNAMVDRLATTRFLAVLGSSGTGKSSVVKTGLLDAIELGLMAKAGSTWRIAECRPGSAPLKNLALALITSESPATPSAADVDLLRGFLARGPRSIIEWCRDGNLTPGTNLLLLVDQFEELFRYQDYARREETQALVALLLESAHSSEFPIYVTITMRSEYLGACALTEGLAEAISSGMVLTPRMTRDQCRAAIERPAGVCGIKLEQTLINRLLNDLASFAPWDDSGVEDQLERLVRRADQLPLLQYTLNRMWLRARERRGDERAGEGPLVLRLSDYQAIGGLSGALNAHADQLLKGLAEKGLEPVVETVFRGLVSGATVADAVRRPRPFGELVRLCGGNEDAVRQVVDTFRMSGCNFLVPELDPKNPKPLDQGAVIDISHESLIRQWGKLSGWLEDEARAAQHWRRLKDRMADGDLLQGRELATLVSWREEMKPSEEWAKRYGGDFAAATAFLDASQRAEQQRRRRTAMIRGAAVAAAIVVPAVILLNQLRIERRYAGELEYDAKQLEASDTRLRTLATNLAIALDYKVQEQSDLEQTLTAMLAVIAQQKSESIERDREMEKMLAAQKQQREQEQRREQEQKPGNNPSGIALGPQPQERVNYADEDTKFDGVEPSSVPVSEVNSPTPTRIPGGTVLRTQELYDAFKRGKLGDYVAGTAGAGNIAFVVVDVWSDPQHRSIPTAKMVPAAGQAGDFEDKVQKELWATLDKITGGDWSMPIVFVSRDAKHWEAYNAALRAIEMGFSRVYWYRGGIASWKAANQPLN